MRPLASRARPENKHQETPPAVSALESGRFLKKAAQKLLLRRA
jgi:hypothetical protein